ncbi:MAG: hypothetical protein V3W45_01285 [Sedimentisphaerales bacterium]
MCNEEKPNNKIKIRRGLLVWSFVLAAMAAIVIGEATLSPVEAYANGETEVVDANVSGSEADVSTDTIIQSITFKKNMRITDALRFLALKYNRNIVPSPKVDGQLAFTSLFNVTFEEAMDAILGGKFEYEQKGNLIEVFPKGDESRMKYTVFALDYISADEAKKLIAPVLSSKGQVGVTTAAETGVPTGESISAQTGGGDTMSLKDTIVVYDYAENIRRAREVITAIDVRPKQVLIEATILSAKLTEDTQFGIDLSSIAGASISVASSEGITTSGFTDSVTGSSGLTAAFSIDDITGFIRALESITDTTILANPKILAVNKQLGQVYIGNKLGYREGDVETTGGGIQEGDVKFLDTGTKLSFRPYIGDDGYIRMDIHSKDSTGTVPSGIPQETSAELVTNIMVKDGQTIVIGGLFRDKTTSAKTQVPLLGDLPIVGAAFRGTADQVVRDEVIVLLTPHIVEEPGEVQGEARAEDVSRKTFGAKEQIQWISKTRLADDSYARSARYYIKGDNESALREVKTALKLRPTYLEAIRLKERIIGETDPNSAAMFERNVLDTIEREDSEKWMRR